MGDGSSLCLALWFQGGVREEVHKALGFPRLASMVREVGRYLWQPQCWDNHVREEVSLKELRPKYSYQ